MSEPEATTNDPKATTESETPVKAPSAAVLKPLRVWPVILLLIGMVVGKWMMVVVQDGPEMLWMVPAFAPALCGILILLWWVTLSRASWKERLGGFVGLIAILVVTVLASHTSIQGPAMTVVTIPMGFAGFGMALIFQASRLAIRRTGVALLVAAVCFGFSGLLRADGGLWGDFSIGLDWRWNASPEEQFLGEAVANGSSGLTSEQLSADLVEPEWPGFRGPDRTGIQRGVKLSGDWKTRPPKQIWKIRVGPGWSSFAVAGDLLFTQEQRGQEETVVCYNASTGDVIWTQSEAGRLKDPLGGPGPRATPTISDGALYATGATGWLMRLDPITGDVVWKVDLKEAAGREPPEWGFCASPLVANGSVIVHTGGDGDKGLQAFDVESGKPTWSAAAGDHAYGSAQLLQLGEREVIGLTDNNGVSLYDAADGTVLLSHEWIVEGYRCLQPILTEQNQLLIPTGIGFGTRSLKLDVDGEAITAEEQWTSRDLKPDYSDCVLFDGHLYGFDGTVFTCIELKTGKRKWKKGRYGKGQVLLVADSRMLLVLSEYGDVVLLKANPESHTEIARVKAIEGKTWNHPVLVRDRLFVRNSEEAACYQLPLE